MWGNITKHVGAAIQKVQKIQNELESQLDAAVGADDATSARPLTEFTSSSVINSVEGDVDESDVDRNAVMNGSLHILGEASLVGDDEVDLPNDAARDVQNNTTNTKAEIDLPNDTARDVKNSTSNITAEIPLLSTIDDIEVEEKFRDTVATNGGIQSADEWDFEINIDERNELNSLSASEVEDIPSQIKVITSAEIFLEVAPETSLSEQSIDILSTTMELLTENAPIVAITEVATETPPLKITYITEAPTVNGSIEEGGLTDNYAEQVPLTLNDTPSSPSKMLIEADALSLDKAFQTTENSIVKSISTVKSVITEFNPLVSLQLSTRPLSPILLIRDDKLPLIPMKFEQLIPIDDTIDSTDAILTDHQISGINDNDKSSIASVEAQENEYSIATDVIDSQKEEAYLLNGRSDSHVSDPVADTDDFSVLALATATLAAQYEQRILDMERMHSAAIETQQKSFDEQLKRVKLEAEATAIAEKSLIDFDAKSQLEVRDAAAAEDKIETAFQIEQLNHSLACVKKELSDAISLATQREISLAKLNADSLKMSEIVVERERALETYAIKMSETHKQLEIAQRRILDLSAEMTEKDTRLRQTQINAAGDGELKKQLIRAQEIMKEKEERLAAFEQEGQNLAKKQSEMEKVVRTTKADVKKRDVEIAKLKESKEQLVKAIEEMQDLVRKNELEASSAVKSLSAMQAVSQASTDKLSRLEGDIGSKADELASQRKAMEAAWAENNESKRLVAELKADRDDLRRQIGLGTSKVMETESSRRDIEQREAVLRATNKQLQDSLQRQMQESGIREERLRDEVGEMRKRWQEAITSRETLSSELGSATAPLLRQISSMQDSMRMKGESWQAVEASLSERALRAESVAEIAELKKVVLEEQTNDLKLQIGLIGTRLQESLTAAQIAESALEKLKKSETALADKVIELESRLALEVGQKQSFQSSLRELELRHKIDQQDAKNAADLIAQQGEGQLHLLKAEAQSLKDQLETERKGSTKRNSTKRLLEKDKSSFGGSSSGNGASNGIHHDLGGFSTISNGFRPDGINEDDASRSHATRYGGNIMPDVVLPSKFS